MTDAARRVARELIHATLLPPLYQALTGRAASPGRASRLGGLLDLLSRDAQFPEAAASLARDTARWGAIWPGMRDRLPAEGQHHLALLETRMGWDADDPSAATRHFLRALGHFGAVLADGEYTRRLATRCGPLDVDDTEIARWILTPHAQAVLDAIAAPQTFDARAAAPHWHVLERAGGKLGDTAATVAASLRVEIVERALAQGALVAADVEPTHSSPEQLGAPLHLLRRLTAGIGNHEEISIWALERAVEWAWPLYKTRALDQLGALMDAVRPFGIHVEELLARGEGAFGRQSLCADFLLFVADNAAFDEQEALFRRGLAVCPGHRNSRLMLSYHKLRVANTLLVRAEAPPGLTEVMTGRRQWRESVASARALVEEAEELFAPNPKIADYRKRVEALEART